MNYPLTIKIAGPAGLGIKSGGLLLSQILLAHGFNIVDYSEYPSLIRGGHNTYQVSFSPQKIYSALRTVDFFYGLESNQFQQHQSEFHSRTRIFAPDAKLTLPDYKNTTCLGSIAALLGLNPKICFNLIKKQYPKFIEQKGCFWVKRI